MQKINKIMTMNEINKKLDGQWVIMQDPKKEKGEIKHGLVLFSGEQRELLKKARSLNIKKGAFFHAGKPNKDDDLLLHS